MCCSVLSQIQATQIYQFIVTIIIAGSIFKIIVVHELLLPLLLLLLLHECDSLVYQKKNSKFTQKFSQNHFKRHFKAQGVPIAPRVWGSTRYFRGCLIDWHHQIWARTYHFLIKAQKSRNLPKN